MQMVMFVLDNPDYLDEVLDVWRAVGVSGVTIIESSGLFRRREPKRVGARYAFGMGLGAQNVEVGHYTLFVIVPDAPTVQRCLEAAESIVGDLSEPNSGVFTAWDLPFVKGVPDQLHNAGGDRS
jgi:hypothetical protein